MLPQKNSKQHLFLQLLRNHIINQKMLLIKNI